MSRIVEATMAGSVSFGRSLKPLSRAIEAAMSEAVLECSKNGITDPAEIRAAMLAARAEVKARWDAAVNAASLKASKGEE